MCRGVTTSQRGSNKDLSLSGHGNRSRGNQSLATATKCCAWLLILKQFNDLLQTYSKGSRTDNKWFNDIITSWHHAYFDYTFSNTLNKQPASRHTKLCWGFTPSLWPLTKRRMALRSSGEQQLPPLWLLSLPVTLSPDSSHTGREARMWWDKRGKKGKHEGGEAPRSLNTGVKVRVRP